MAADDLSLLRAHAIALSAWSQDAAKATESQQPANGMQQPAHALSELQDCGKWLSRAAISAMQLMREHDLRSCIDEQLLLETLEQLIEPVRNVTDLLCTASVTGTAACQASGLLRRLVSILSGCFQLGWGPCTLSYGRLLFCHECLPHVSPSSHMKPMRRL